MPNLWTQFSTDQMSRIYERGNSEVKEEIYCEWERRMKNHYYDEKTQPPPPHVFTDILK